MPDFENFDPGDLPDLGDLDDFTLDDYIDVMLDWNVDDYPSNDWLEQLAEILKNLGNYNWEDIDNYVNNARTHIDNSTHNGGGGSNGGGSNGGSENPFIFTTGGAGSIYTTDDDSKESNGGLGAAALGGVLFFQMQQEVYKPYWSKNKPTKTAPVRPE